jgi:hypothetical protein
MLGDEAMKGDCMTDQEAATAAEAREQYTHRCPTCEQPVPPDQAKIKLGDNGLIVAASLKSGLGPPLVSHETCHEYAVLLDGQPMNEVVAFDCEQGALWRYQKDAEGHLIIRNGTVLIEKLKGAVRVELHK